MSTCLPPISSFTIAARRGLAVRMARDSILRVVNTHGSQVVDTWAFNAADMSEFMSMEHTRAGCRKLCPGPGESFCSNRRRPVLTLLADTSPGIHDTLIAACDVYRYQLLGCTDHHDNCTDNLHQALLEQGLASSCVPCPLNLFMNIPVQRGELKWLASRSQPGNYVDLKAEIDCIVVFSACPMDLIPINGEACLPQDAHCHFLPVTA